MQFKVIAGLFAPTLIMVFLLCPEHAFVRNRKFETDLVSEGSSVNVDEEKQEIGGTAASEEQKKTFLQELKVYNGRFSTDGFWKLLIAPFPAMLYPAAIWVFIFQGTFVTWVSPHYSGKLAILRYICMLTKSPGYRRLYSPSPNVLRTTLQLQLHTNGIHICRSYNWCSSRLHPLHSHLRPSLPLPHQTEQLHLRTRISDLPRHPHPINGGPGADCVRLRYDHPRFTLDCTQYLIWDVDVCCRSSLCCDV